MANVEHSALTGSNLHEPKGANTATVSTVYVSDGVGSGAWSTLGVASLAGSAKAFQGQLLHVRDEKAATTVSGTFTSGAWRTRTLNTVKTNEITSASLASNQITLPAGTYYIEAKAPAYAVAAHQVRLQNITDATTTITGITSSSPGASTCANSELRGRFTIAVAKTFELQHFCQTTIATNGFGLATGWSTVEVYAEVVLWKVA